MRVVAIELSAVFAFTAVGWVALWPARNRLGAFAYHLAALPTGLMAAPLALVVSSASKRPLDALSAASGGLLLIAILWALQRLVLEADSRCTTVRPASFVVAGGAALCVGGIAGFLGLSASNYDSMSSYWPLGVTLNRVGAYTVGIASSRSPIIPSMNAIHVLFGSDWAYVVYPMLGATLALWLGMALWAGPLSDSAFNRGAKRLVTGTAVTFLFLEPSYILNLFLAHTQMISAVYLLIALSSLWMAIRPDKDEVNTAFLLLAGIASAGLALSRPDGLAYQFVAVAAAISALTIHQVRLRNVAAFFAPLLVLVSVTYSAAFLKLGVWKASKLDGTTVLAILAVVALSAVGPWVVQGVDRAVRPRVRGERFLALLVSASSLLLAGVFALKWGTARIALNNAGVNLFLGAGAYSYLWYAVVALLVLTVLSGDALRTGSWTRPAFLGVLLFFVIAGLVHGTSHAGRIGPGDSFNRVAFEILPVVVWLAGAVVARILAPAEAEST